MRNSISWKNVFDLRTLSVAGLIAMSACSLEPPGRESTLRIEIDPSLTTRDSDRALSVGSDFLPGLLSIAPPASASAFDCMFVNVMGPGIGQSPSDPDPMDVDSTLQRAYAGEACAYLGIHVPPLAFTAREANLSVPSGPGRVIQVIGIKDNNAGTPACGTQFPNDSGGGNTGYFELSRAVVDLFSDVSVSLSNQYDSASNKAAKEVECNRNGRLIYSGSPFTATAHGYGQSGFFLKFTPSETLYLKSVQLRVSTDAANPATLKMAIHPDSGLTPAKPQNTPTHIADEATAIAANSTAVDLTYSMYNAGTQYLQLTANTQYWLRIYDDSGNASLKLHQGSGGNADDCVLCTLGSVSCSSIGISSPAVQLYGSTN